MTETTTDSGGGFEQTATAPVSTETPAPSSPEMGMGFSEPDTFVGESSPTEPEQPEEDATPAAAEAAPATETTETPTDDGGTLRQDDYTRKTQQLADDRRALEERERQFVERERQTLEKAREDFATQQAAGNGQQTLVQQIQTAMSDPNLSPQDRVGLQVFGQLAQTVEEQATELARLKGLEETVQQYGGIINEQATKQQTEQSNLLQEQMSEAVDLFGEQALRDSIPFLRLNYGKATNRTTGKPYTIAEMVGLESGKSLEEAQAARKESKDQRAAAKTAAKPVVAGSAANGGAGGSTEAQAIAEIGKTM